MEQDIRIPSQWAENRKKIGQTATVENHIRKPTEMHIFTYEYVKLFLFSYILIIPNSPIKKKKLKSFSL